MVGGGEAELNHFPYIRLSTYNNINSFNSTNEQLLYVVVKQLFLIAS